MRLLFRLNWVARLLLMAGLPLLAAAGDAIPLAGQWRFQLDRADVGVKEAWFNRTLPDTIKLPGTLAAQGIGDDVGLNTPWMGGVQDREWFKQERYAPYAKPDNFKFPFWLQPEKYYAGAAWFQHDIEIPTNWGGRRVVLFLERAHWETRLWVDGKLTGTNNSLSTPHEYDLGQLPPGKHTLTLRVDNRMIVDVGRDSHSVSDHTQGNWNGIVGKIELRTTPLVWIEEVQIQPDPESSTARLKVRIGSVSAHAFHEVLWYRAVGKSGGDRAKTNQGFGVYIQTNGCVAELECEMGSKSRFWDEFTTNLFEMKLALTPVTHSPGFQDEKSLPFGMRSVSTSDTQLTINGQKTFLRGTLDCCIFPKTGHPPMEVEEWRRIIRVAKSYGLNLIRFHSWCPPEAAFQAADELGFYFHIEAASWANSSTSLGDGKPVDQWLYDETDRILKYYGNHPSFLLMTYGNEPGGKKANAYLAKYVNHYKALDPRRLWSSGAGWPELPENQWHCSPGPRVQAWGQGLNSRINAKPPETMTDYRDYIAKRNVPVVSHEIGQWCVYPNFDEIKKYTGYLKPKNFEIFRDRLEANGMGKLAKQFLLASGKLQTLCYKEDIESALRTPGMGGFELLDLHDFPGQGTALVGVLDPFWEEKGYVTAKEFSRFCNSTVPLARLKKRVFTTDETLEAEIEVANFGAGVMMVEEATWLLVTDGGKVVAEGRLQPKSVPVDNGVALGKAAAELRNVNVPASCKLVVRVSKYVADDLLAPGGLRRQLSQRYENDWDIWVYPAQPKTEPTPDVLVTSQFDEAAQKHLASGGKLLLTIPGKQVRNFDTEPVKLGFSSIFWNTAWTGRQAPTTLGILCDPKHPALAEFPTEFHSNWQWWYLIHRAGALRLDLLPKGIEPIVRVIDDWFTARPLGLVVEGKVGRGKVVVCGFDLTRDADDPVSRQMRASLLSYMNSGKFAPKTELRVAEIESLAVPSKTAKLRGVRRITASSAEQDYEAANAVDGDPATFWHSAWESSPAQFPHELVIELEAPQAIAGFAALPRQDGNCNGWISNYAIHISSDGRNWGQPFTSGAFPADARKKTGRFAKPVTGRFIKLVALGGHASGPWASLAELELIPATQPR